MNDPTFALLTFLTICSWMVTLYCIYQAWDRRRQLKSGNMMLGYVDRIISDENGVRVEGRFNEDGMARVKKQEAAGMSLGFHYEPQIQMTDNVRTITDAKLHSVSLDAEPGPYGGKIDFVGTQPDER